MTKSEIILSFGILFQDYLYKAKKPLTKQNINAWLKKEKWDDSYQVLNLYTDEHMRVKFKYKEMNSKNLWRSYEAMWTLKY